MNYDEAKAICLQHVMVSQLKRPGKMDALFKGMAESGIPKFGHGKRRWRGERIELKHGVLR